MKFFSRLWNPLYLVCLIPLLALPAAADGGFDLGALLSGAQEIPDTGSEGSARATVRFDKGFTQLVVRVVIDPARAVGTATTTRPQPAGLHVQPSGC